MVRFEQDKCALLKVLYIFGLFQAGQRCMYVTQSVFFLHLNCFKQDIDVCYLKPGVFSRADDGEASRGETKENIESRVENIKMQCLEFF